MGSSGSSLLAGAPTNASLCAHTAEMGAKHAELAAQLQHRGFDRVAMDAAAKSFVEAGTELRPRRYAESPWWLPRNAVRVLALPLDDENLTDAHARRLARMALIAASQIAAALPAGSRSWQPPAGSLHTTILHPGLSPTAAMPVHADINAAQPSAVTLDLELHTARRLAAHIPADSVALVVDRLALTPAGVLLLLLKPTNPAAAVCVPSLRAAAAAAFPHAASRQTSGLVHVSLLRVLSLPEGAHGANSSAAMTARRLVADWNGRLQGMGATVRGLLYVRESQIITLEGQRWRLRFGGGGERRALPTLRRVLMEGGTRPGYDHDRGAADL